MRYSETGSTVDKNVASDVMMLFDFLPFTANSVTLHEISNNIGTTLTISMKFLKNISKYVDYKR